MQVLTAHALVTPGAEFAWLHLDCRNILVLSTTPGLLPAVLPGLSVLLLWGLMEEQAPTVPKETAPGSVFAFDGLLPFLLLHDLVLGLLRPTLSLLIVVSLSLLLSLLRLTTLSPTLYLLPGQLVGLGMFKIALVVLQERTRRAISAFILLNFMASTTLTSLCMLL